MSMRDRLRRRNGERCDGARRVHEGIVVREHRGERSLPGLKRRSAIVCQQISRELPARARVGGEEVRLIVREMLRIDVRAFREEPAMEHREGRAPSHRTPKRTDR